VRIAASVASSSTDDAVHGYRIASVREERDESLEVARRPHVHGVRQRGDRGGCGGGVGRLAEQHAREVVVGVVGGHQPARGAHRRREQASGEVAEVAARHDAPHVTT
jgi:hypothetical protein